MIWSKRGCKNRHFHYKDRKERNKIQFIGKKWRNYRCFWGIHQPQRLSERHPKCPQMRSGCTGWGSDPSGTKGEMPQIWALCRQAGIFSLSPEGRQWQNHRCFWGLYDQSRLPQWHRKCPPKCSHRWTGRIKNRHKCAGFTFSSQISPYILGRKLRFFPFPLERERAVGTGDTQSSGVPDPLTAPPASKISDFPDTVCRYSGKRCETAQSPSGHRPPDASTGSPAAQG